MLSPDLIEFSHEILRVCNSQFPKTCGSCGKTFPSFKNFVETVSPIGAPKIDTIEDDDPIGLMSYSNCPCGSTLALRCESGSNEVHRLFNIALHQEAIVSKRSTQDVLIELREMVRKEAIMEE